MPQIETRLSQLTVANGEALVWGVRTYVMGIINVAPDSFSGDGLNGDVHAIVDRALRIQEDGADILDIGAESTRPGHKTITSEEELVRLMPALEAISGQVRLPISVDTSKAAVARQAVEAGAVIINDVSGLQADPELAQVAASSGAGLILMHNQQGTQYQNLLPDIASSLRTSVNKAVISGVPIDNIIIDPGFGFGKTPDHNLEVLARLNELQALRRPILVGSSRKSTLGLLLGLPVDQRVEGTAATVTLAISGGANIVRVHDVKEMVRVCRVADAVVHGWRPHGWNKS